MIGRHIAPAWAIALTRSVHTALQYTTPAHCTVHCTVHCTLSCDAQYCTLQCTKLHNTGALCTANCKLQTMHCTVHCKLHAALYCSSLHNAALNIHMHINSQGFWLSAAPPSIRIYGKVHFLMSQIDSKLGCIAVYINPIH